MVSKYQRSMLWSPIAVSNHGDAGTEVGRHCCKFLPFQVTCPPNLKGQSLFIFFYFPSSIFSLSFRSQIFRDYSIQKQPPVQRSFDFLYMPREECRLKKDLKFTPQSESHTDGANHGQRGESDFQSYYIKRFQCPVFNKDHKAYKEIR